MKFLVVGPPSIYHGCSTRKTFWEEKFTGKKQDSFEPANMRNCGKRNFMKHREIKDSDELVTYVLNMENMDRKPAAKIDPIKETPSLNKTSHLGKRLREAESELQVDMRPIHQLSSISRNPFSTEALT